MNHVISEPPRDDEDTQPVKGQGPTPPVARKMRNPDTGEVIIVENEQEQQKLWTSGWNFVVTRWL